MIQVPLCKVRHLFVYELRGTVISTDHLVEVPMVGLAGRLESQLLESCSNYVGSNWNHTASVRKVIADLRDEVDELVDQYPFHLLESIENHIGDVHDSGTTNPGGDAQATPAQGGC